jgi:hypothetical protein
MAHEPLFIDSGGFYALVAAESTVHSNAVTIMEESRREQTLVLGLGQIRNECPHFDEWLKKLEAFAAD